MVNIHRYKLMLIMNISPKLCSLSWGGGWGGGGIYYHV